MTVLPKGQGGQRLCRGCRRHMGGGWKNVPDGEDSTASLCKRCYEAWQCADSKRGRELILKGMLDP